MAYLSSVRAVCAALAILFFWTNAARAETAIASVDLNLRYGPGFEHPVILTIPGGSVLDVEDCTYGWCYVYWTDYEGYASEDYLRFGGYAGYAQQYVPPPVTVYRPYFVPVPAYRYRGDNRPRHYNTNRHRDHARTAPPRPPRAHRPSHRQQARVAPPRPPRAHRPANRKQARVAPPRPPKAVKKAVNNVRKAAKAARRDVVRPRGNVNRNANRRANVQRKARAKRADNRQRSGKAQQRRDAQARSERGNRGKGKGRRG